MGHDKTNYFALLILSGLTGAFVAYTLLHEPLTATLKTYAPVSFVEVGATKVTIPSWNIFTSGNIWQLVSTNHELAKSYTPSLVTTTVTHSPSATQVATITRGPLSDLVAGAKAQGVKLMLSSAYRSYSDQETVYGTYLNSRGRAYVQEYVAVPGQSEHQTGLAVDFTTPTNACLVSADTCSLDAVGIAWLTKHAAEFGFIERYPEGKQSITGIAGEHWHYRYVGVPLAKALTTAGMTLDEFVAQVAPGI